MKKNIVLFLLTVGNIFSAQTSSYNSGVTQPVPSIASLATYNNVPVSIQTGTPNISYPLVGVSTNSKSVSINLGLSYHAGRISKDTWTGEVGKGWSISGQGAISREIVNDFDEVFDDASTYNYIKNEFNDTYNFNIPGESGKFRIIRNVAENTFHIIKLSPYTSKIRYTRTANTATLILDSFTITTDEGIQYKFQDINISKMKVWVWTHPNNGGIYGDRLYRSAFYLTSISDQNNQELVKYTYTKDLQYQFGTHGVESEINKLTHIDAKDHGSIEINYTKDNLRSKNDQYSIENIVLRNAKNGFVKKYKFSYLNSSYLTSLTRVDHHDQEIEKINFEYREIQSLSPDNKHLTYNALQKVKLPTGGIVHYDFDLVPYSYRDSVMTSNAPEIDVASITMDQFNANLKKYYFTLPQDKQLNIEILSSQLPNSVWSLNFYKKNGRVYQPTTYQVGPTFEADPNYPPVQTRSFTAGEYYVELSSSDMNAQFGNAVTFRAFYYDGAPVETDVKIPKEAFLRIKKIRSFDLASTHNYSVPSKIEEFDYHKFDDPTATSSFFTDGGNVIGNSETGMVMYNPAVIYKNVKVSHGNNTGYTKYYFKAPDAFEPVPTEEQGGKPIWPNYNIMREGLLDKKELYNSDHQKVAEDYFSYHFEEFPAPRYLVAPVSFASNFYLKTAWIRNQKVISKSIFSSGNIETVSETFRNINSYKTSLEKNTSFDGSIQETSYLYATDKNNQKLITANMTGIPLETTTTVKKNASDPGKLLSKAETKYDNPAHYFPSSILSYDSQNSLVSEVTFNRYDAKGNPEQYTTKDGIPVSFVWGYSKTQPIAKIEGATYAQVEPYISDIVAKSDADVNDTTELQLQNALDAFRTLPQFAGFQITTYVYDPLIGMKSTTPPSGIRAVYRYDSAGRLKQIEDENGTILKKHEYNYSH